MKNRYFTDEMLEVIGHPERWKIVSSSLPVESPTIQNERHRNWMRTHSDSHPAREALVCFSGKAYCGFKDKIYLCDSGTIFFFDSFESHDRLYPSHYPDSVHMWLIFLNNMTIAHLYDIRRGKSSTVASFLLKGDPAAVSFVRTWDSALEGKLPESFQRSKIISFFSTLLLHIAEKGYFEDKPKETLDYKDEIFESIMQNIRTTGGHGFNLAKTAKLAGMSKYHFHRLFREYSAETLHSFVDKARLKKVSELRKKGMNMTEISNELGFSSLSVLLRWLKTKKMVY